MHWLSARLWSLAVLVDVRPFARAIEAHAAKLHSSSVNGVVAWHDDGFLLVEKTTLEARGSVWHCSAERARRVSAKSTAGAGAKGGGGCGANSAGRRHGRRWVRVVGNVLEVILCEGVLGRSECGLGNEIAIGVGGKSVILLVKIERSSCVWQCCSGFMHRVGLRS